MIAAVIITPEGIAYPVSNLEYDSISKAVGGYIERVPPFGANVTAYCNEEGKLAGLPHNRHATQLIGLENLLPGDYIAGSMWISGPIDPAGDETPIRPSWVEKIKWLVLENGGCWSEEEPDGPR